MCMDKQNIMEGYEEANNQTICVNVSMTHVIAREKKMIKQFARIHTSSLIKIEKILNKPITKFYNSDDVMGLRQSYRSLK